MQAIVQVISSMATRLLLEELVEQYAAAGRGRVRLESVGGVEAARRIAAGERFDLAVLASGAIDKLIESGQVCAAGRVDLVRSTVAAAVPAGAAHPDIGSEDSLRRCVLAAGSIGYSTGPSGDALAELFDRWGIAGEIADRIRVPPPGTPVGALLQSGEVQLGFQQLSELMPLEGVDILGPLPAPVRIESVFSGGICVAGEAVDAAGRLLDYLASDAAAPIKRRHGMEPAASVGITA